MKSLFTHFAVNKQSYYSWVKNGRKNYRDWDENLVKAIINLHNKYNFYGYKRIHKQLVKDKIADVHINTIYSYMKRLGIKGYVRKMKFKYPKLITDNFVYSNLLFDRVNLWNFEANKPNEKWSVDITYIHNKNAKMFLFAIKDLYDKRIVSYEIAKTYDCIFVTKCLEKALKENDVSNLIIHSDRGSQFTSAEYLNLLNKYNVKISMSRKSHPLDNAPIESFFRTFKNEIDIEKINTLSTENAISEIHKYIEFYNVERISIKLKGMTPYEYGNHSSKSLILKSPIIY